jgi:hypothetical protein
MNLNIFSNGSSLQAFVSNNSKPNFRVNLLEKDFKSFEANLKHKLSKNTNTPSTLVGYRKKLFK